jgi:hypothetical protein
VHFIDHIIGAFLSNVSARKDKFRDLFETFLRIDLEMTEN